METPAIWYWPFYCVNTIFISIKQLWFCDFVTLILTVFRILRLIRWIITQWGCLRQKRESFCKVCLLWFDSWWLWNKGFVCTSTHLISAWQKSMCFVTLGSTRSTNDLIVELGRTVLAFLAIPFDFSKALEITMKWLLQESSKQLIYAIEIILSPIVFDALPAYNTNAVLATIQICFILIWCSLVVITWFDWLHTFRVEPVYFHAINNTFHQFVFHAWFTIKAYITFKTSTIQTREKEVDTTTP